LEVPSLASRGGRSFSRFNASGEKKRKRRRNEEIGGKSVRGGRKGGKKMGGQWDRSIYWRRDNNTTGMGRGGKTSRAVKGAGKRGKKKKRLVADNEREL